MMGRVMGKGVDGVAEGATVGEAVSEAVVAAAFAEGEEEADGDFEGTNFIMHSVALVGGAWKSRWHVLLMPMEYPMYESAQC
jgi:N-acetylglucosamine kinase-like BadF-type ATPase